MHKEVLQKSWKRTEWSIRSSGTVAELSLWECIIDLPFKASKETEATFSLLFCFFFLYFPFFSKQTRSPLFLHLLLYFFWLLLLCALFWLHFAVSLAFFSCSCSSPPGYSGLSAIQQFLVGFLWSREGSTSCVNFSVLQCVTWPWVPLSKAPFLHAPLPQRVVSFPHDQHFCCLCFWLYLRSPSSLLCPSHSSRREQLCSVVEMFHWIFTSGVSFQTLQSATMELQRPEWLLPSAHS